MLEQTFHAKRERARAEKERIALRAAELVQPGMVVALDSGTTTWRLAAALKGLGRTPADVLIATKWMPALRRARSIGRTIGRRLESLGGFRIDLHQIHNPMSVSSLKAQLSAMADLADAGSIRQIGISNFSAKRMFRAHALLAARGRTLASNQVHYSLLHRKIETNGVLDAAKRLGVSIIAYSPLEQGILTGRFHDDPAQVRALSRMRRSRGFFRAASLARSRPVIEALREIGARHGASPAQVALNWLVTFHGETVVAIPGASREAQARDNAGAMGFVLTRDEMGHLDRISAPFKA